MKIYVYTTKAEKRAEEIGVEPRRAGTVAMCGRKAVSGMTALAWKKKGYIYEFEWERINKCIR